MDGRKAMAPGAVLRFRNRNGGEERYTIKSEIGRGGSCIVYDASYEDNAGNRKLVRIKECYPYVLELQSDRDGVLRAKQQDEEVFAAAKRKMKDAYLRNHQFFINNELTNTVTNTVDIYEAYGTVWIVSTWLNGSTLENAHPETLKACVSLVLAAAKALQAIHEAGYLYLDLKPENIMTIRGVTELVQLFDFDSMIAHDELEKALHGGGSLPRLSYTKSFAPPELQTGKLRLLGAWSDVYSLGAVLFSLLWNRTPTVFDGEMDSAFDYQRFRYASTAYQDRLYRALTVFLHRTLASYAKDRYQSMDEAITELETIVQLADEQKPYLFSSVLSEPDTFFGRKKELSLLEQFLSSPEPVLALTGMGGIGKSALVRKYIALHRDPYDAVLYLYDKGAAVPMLTDDASIHVNTVHRTKEETKEEYFYHKLNALKSICAKQRVFAVIDQFDPIHWNDLRPLFTVGWQVLLVSRERLPDGLCPSMRIGEMDGNDLADMFFRYTRMETIRREDMDAFMALANITYGHTLTMELLARQIAKSHLTVREAFTLVEIAGFQAFPKDHVAYLRDGQVVSAPLGSILERLMEAGSFTEEDRIMMLELAMFDLPGIDIGLFRALTGRQELGRLTELESGGWVKADGRRLSLHPLMREIVLQWPRAENARRALEKMAERLYNRIRPKGSRHDSDKQFSADYAVLLELLCIADQLQTHNGEITPANQRLRYRILMDTPVDQDAYTLQKILQLLDAPKYLNNGSILRLFETSAFLFGRMAQYEDAITQLKKMRSYLVRHPSAYYLSAYHRAMAVILHNADEQGNLKKCLQHEDMAIAAIRLSPHPDAGKQLAACLLDKAVTLLSADMDRKQAGELIDEAKPLIERYTEPADYERYQYFCTAAMCRAMNGDTDAAEKYLASTDAIAFEMPDSDLSVAEHLTDQAAPIRIAMGQYGEAEEAVLQAIELCKKHEGTARYRETCFDAYLFLGRIYAMDHAYIEAEKAFEEAEKRIADSPYEWELPLCPEDIRLLADKERNLLEPPNTPY